MADIQVRSSGLTAPGRKPEAPKQVAQEDKLPQIGGDSLVRDGAPPADNPFKDAPTYTKAVETAETGLRAARTRQADAERNRAATDSSTAKSVADVQAARDAKHAEAIKPLNASKEALTARKAELQAPIDETTGKLGIAREELESTTYPNKKVLDAARADAHSVVSRNDQALRAAQSRLDAADGRIAQNDRDLSVNRSSLSQDKSDLAVNRSNLGVAMSVLTSAKWNAPGEYDWEQMQRTHRQATADFREGEQQVGEARDRVDYRRRDLNRLITSAGGDSGRPTPPDPRDGDRPVPPGIDTPQAPGTGPKTGKPGDTKRPTPPAQGSGRPTPPGETAGSHSNTKSTPWGRPRPPGDTAGRQTPPGATPATSGRPTPPSAGSSTSGRPTPPPVSGGTSDRPAPPPVDTGRPVPPPVNADTEEIRRARGDLKVAQRDLDQAESRLRQLGDRLQDVRARYEDMSLRVDDVNRKAAAVQALDAQSRQIQANMAQTSDNIRILESRISGLQQDRQNAPQPRAQAGDDLDAARNRAQKLDTTPYDKGDPTRIMGAQAKVDRLETTLDKFNKAYTEGIKAPTEKVAQEQATYDAAMAGPKQAVTNAERNRQTGLAAADQKLSSARGEVKNGEDRMTYLKDVSGVTKLKWNMPKWLGGQGFNVDKFWKGRPAA